MRGHVVIRRFSENGRMDAKQTLGVRGCYGRHPMNGVVAKPFNCRYPTALKLRSRWRCCNVLFKQFFSFCFYNSSIFCSVLVHWRSCGRWVSSELYLLNSLLSWSLLFYYFFNYGVAHWEYGLLLLRLTGIYFITILLCKVLTNDLIL